MNEVPVVLCVPVQSFEDENEFTAFVSNCSERFGAGSKINLVSKCPDRWVIEDPSQLPSAIPSISLLDRSFQEVETLPPQIDEIESECSKMSRFIRAIVEEIESAKKERDRLESEVAELQKELSLRKMDINVKHGHGKKIRHDARKLIDRLLPPSEFPSV